nr:unnamed protein product [Callosobruchus analis]
MVADHQPPFLCVTEHWLTSETISLFVPQGYKLVSSSCRSTGEHGGAAVYARLDVECTPADNITKMSKVPYLECAAVETKSKSEPIKSKIDSADNKSQAMWRIINKLTGKNNPSKIFPEGDLQITTTLNDLSI